MFKGSEDKTCRLITKSGGRGLGRNKLEACSYEFKVEGAELTLKPGLLSIAITGGGMSISHSANGTQQLVATGTYDSGPTQVLTTVVTWASSDVTKAAVTKSGLAVAIAAGTPNVTATYMGIVGTAVLTVT